MKKIENTGFTSTNLQSTLEDQKYLQVIRGDICTYCIYIHMYVYIYIYMQTECIVQVDYEIKIKKK